MKEALSLVLGVLALAGTAVAEEPCTKATIEKRMAEVSEKLRSPKGQAVRTAVEKDFAEDHDIDDLLNAEFVMAEVTVEVVGKSVAGGNLAEACRILKTETRLLDDVVNAE